MNPLPGRCVWGGRLISLLAGAVFFSVFTGCASLPAPAAQAPSAIVASEDDEFSQLIAQLRSDLSRNQKREDERQPKRSSATSANARDREFAEKANALFAQLTSLYMPVVGVRPRDLDDSWGAPRDGGVRSHRGIDIFAPRGTSVVAVIDGIISYIGDQPKGGHCLWLTTESGTSFYYAHLDRWAPGIYEGMEVQTGDLLGYVGNTGNAITTPPHLHFAVNQNDEMVNPFPALRHAVIVSRAHPHVELGGGYGTR